MFGSCHKRMRGGAPKYIRQSYEIVCGRNTYEIALSTLPKPKKAPVSRLEILLINGKPPTNPKAVKRLRDTFEKLGGIDLPPTSQCLPSTGIYESHGKIALGSYWRQRNEALPYMPIWVHLYFHSDGLFEFLVFEDPPDGNYSIGPVDGSLEFLHKGKEPKQE